MSADEETRPDSDSGLSWERALQCAFVWQVVPSAWLMWNAWDSPSSLTFYLRTAVFFVIPFVSSLFHRTWRVGIAAVVLPVFAIGVMMSIYMLMMPTGKW